MSSTVRSEAPGPGTSLKTLGGLALLVAVVVAIWSVSNGDYITAGAVLLYIPVGLLLYNIGSHPEKR